jgi:hypothetical protein
MWVPPEIKDPILQHASTRKSVACFGAVSLITGQFVRMRFALPPPRITHRYTSQ